MLQKLKKKKRKLTVPPLISMSECKKLALGNIIGGVGRSTPDMTKILRVHGLCIRVQREHSLKWQSAICLA